MSQITEYTQKIEDAIDACPDCEDLEKLKDQVIQYLADQLTSIASDIEGLEALSDIPTDLSSLISWVTTFIEKNVTGPYNKALALQAEIAAAQVSLMAKITTKIASLQCDFSI